MTIIVCDTGSGSLKLGVVGACGDSNLPTLCVPNVVGEPTVRAGSSDYDHFLNENETDAMKILRKFTLNTPSIGPSLVPQSTPVPTSVVVGSKVFEYEGNVALKYPMKKGQVVDWDAMSEVWQSSLQQLNGGEEIRSPLQTSSSRLNKRQRTRTHQGSSIVLSESVRGLKRDKVFELMFETMGFDRVNVSPQAALILSARGTTTGLIVDCGDGLTQITPVAEGYVQKQGVRTLEIAGRKISERLFDLMRRSDNNSYKLGYRQCESVKEKFCYLSTNIEEERFVADTTNVLSRKICLPDGTEILMNRERFLAPEILFEPKFAGDANSDSLGIAAAVQDSINASAIDLRTGFYKSIILAGGSTMIPGFSRRLKQELGDFDPSVDEVVHRQFLSFQGGCVMAELNEARGMDSKWWISRADYQEKGVIYNS